MSSIRNQNGNTILMMLVMIAGLSLATIAMFGSSQVYDSSGQRFIARQKALYVSDGTRAFAVQLTQDFLKEFPASTNADVEAYLTASIPPLLPTGYSVSDVHVTMTPQGTLIIPNGTFKGMVAPQVLVKFSYIISKGVAGAENRISHHFDAVVTLAQVGLHQFMYFIDLESAGFNPGPATKVNGRMHANGDLCLAGGTGTGLEVLKVSAAGRLMQSYRTECGANRQAGFSVSRTWISTSNDINGPKAQLGLGVTPTTRNDNGCVNCLSSGQGWKEYALSRWNTNAQDSAHNVPKLALPLPDNIQAQLGGNGSNPYIAYSNSKNLRFLVDPVNPGDSEQVKKMKYAYNADIRIIDGVWYLRDAANPNAWPGKVIWSDHPGQYTVPAPLGPIAVGQETLRSTLGWGAVPPKKFSYYGYNETTKTLDSTLPGVTGAGTISYGTLARTGTGTSTRWYPGHLISSTVNTAGSQNLCPVGNPPATTSYTSLATPPTFTNTTTFPSPHAPLTISKKVSIHSDVTSLACSSGGLSPTVATNLLNGTRSGLNDPHIAWFSKIFFDTYPHATTIPNDRSRILPVNFDVQHFQAALADTTPGELGSYFTHNGSKTDFNGIVYITTTWPGSTNGFSPRGVPTAWPNQNDGGFKDDTLTTTVRQGDLSQIPMTADEQQRSLPFPLCSTNLTNGFDTVGSSFHFTIPACARYKYPPVAATDLTAYPNAIRIHNGAVIDTTVFKKGLSIVSNVPVYIQGSYNTTSVVSPATSTNWIPTLIAGDQITVLSDAWDDVNAPFAIWNRGAATSRTATSTTYNVSLLAGWAMHQGQGSTTNEALHSMPALMEDWTSAGVSMSLNGSIAIGYYPVYYRGGRYYSNAFADTTDTQSSYNYATYKASSKSINYDKHLEMISNQPPGSPVFYTSSTQSWKIK